MRGKGNSLAFAVEPRPLTQQGQGFDKFGPNGAQVESGMPAGGLIDLAKPAQEIAEGD